MPNEITGRPSRRMRLGVGPFPLTHVLSGERGRIDRLYELYLCNHATFPSERRFASGPRLGANSERLFLER